MANLDIHHEFRITLSRQKTDYPVYVTSSGIEDEGFLRGLTNSSQALIVTNKKIAAYYLKYVSAAFDDTQCDTVILPDGEQYKNQESLYQIYETLIKGHHHRDTTLIALGGGVIGDITGFAAATYQRGVSFIQIPTTLLAQVDASVGGKTAINHPLGKNLIGSFYQPSAVMIDINTLMTLDDREFNSGVAEVIKYALLAGEPLMSQLNEFLSNIFLWRSHSETLSKIIKHCCEIKAEFVRNDETEHGSRALLNLGHTFAHALESYTNYERWLHGEAVAIGLYCASILSNHLGFLSDEHVRSIEQMLIRSSLPYRIPQDIKLDTLLKRMYLDKKIKNNQLNFVLLKKPGDCFLYTGVTDEQLNRALMAAIEGEREHD